MAQSEQRLFSASRVVCALALAIISGAALATAQRTFVASNGVDTNPCSIAAPCRSFTAAIAQTNDGGEIIVIDSAGYGPVTIAKSISITAPAGVYAGVSVVSGIGITVAGTNIEVTLRGLSINGQGGTNGVIFTSGKSLIVERCTVTGMNGIGILVSGGPSALLTVALSDVSIERNASAVRLTGLFDATIENSRVSLNTSDAIVAIATGSGASLTATRLTVSGNGGLGVAASASASPSDLSVRVESSVLVRNLTGLIAKADPGGTVLFYAVDNRVEANAAGVEVQVGNALMVLSGNVVSANLGAGITQTNPGTVNTMGNNVVQDNGGGNIIGGPLNVLTFN